MNTEQGEIIQNVCSPCLLSRLQLKISKWKIETRTANHAICFHLLYWHEVGPENIIGY